MSQGAADTEKKLRCLQRRFDRERTKVAELERLIEDKTRELFEANMQLEARVEQRTRELADARAVAEASGEARKHFLAQMSHELRTPMNGVIGVAELLRRTRLDAEQREQVETIIASGRHLLGLIGNILDFSKIDAGKLDLELRSVSLREMLAATVRTLEVGARARGLELRVSVDERCPDAIEADGVRVRQVLTNLVGNAIKFTSEGHVAIRVELGRGGGDDDIVLSWCVSDTGCGIPDDRLTGIFDPFAQAEAATSRRFGGTGLGLAITRQLVALMGGDILATSKVGSGSAFHFTTRHRPGSLAAAPCRARHGGLPSGLRVLAVDDHPVNLRVAEGMLQALGVACVRAESGHEALDLFGRSIVDEQPFDLILLDCHMPGMSGYEVAQAIRESDFDAPILACSADASPENRAHVRAAGMDGLLPKPYGLEELEGALAQWVGVAAPVVELERQPESEPEPAPASAPAEPASDSAASRPGFDVEELRARVGGNEALMGMVVEAFLASWPSMREALCASVGLPAETVHRALHTCKGSAASVGANAASDLAARLETAPESFDRMAAERLCAEVERACAEMRRWTSTRAA